MASAWPAQETATPETSCRRTKSPSCISPGLYWICRRNGQSSLSISTWPPGAALQEVSNILFHLYSPSSSCLARVVVIFLVFRLRPSHPSPLVFLFFPFLFHSNPRHRPGLCSPKATIRATTRVTIDGSAFPTILTALLCLFGKLGADAKTWAPCRQLFTFRSSVCVEQPACLPRHQHREHSREDQL